MNKLLVNAPTGRQEIIVIGPGGSYFDPHRVLWDERFDGPMPEVTLGGMLRLGGYMVVDQSTGMQHRVGGELLFYQAAQDASSVSKLASAKAEKNVKINQWREQANGSTFPYAGKHIACDRLSKDDIMGTALHVLLFNAFPDDFPGAWKATDNSYLPMPDIATFKAMFSAMTNQGSLNFAYSQELKTQLANATTLAAVNEIVW